MKRLVVDYLPDERVAKLELIGAAPAWAEIRALCEERVADVENSSASSLTVPWWGFLSCRRAIAYVLDRYQIEFFPTKAAEELLISALDNEKRFQSALQTKVLSLAALNSLLSKLKFKRTLTPEQSRNAAKLLSLPAGATFSVPGAGKTTEALAYYWASRSSTDQLLVIAPKNAFAAWEEQANICIGDRVRFVRLRGGAVAVRALLSQRPQHAIITYQQLAIVKDQIAEYISSSPTYVFVDESHRMKRGVDGKLGNAILTLSHLPKAKLILSGTPLPNHVSDLIPQFDFLYPEIRADESTIVQVIQPVYVRTTKKELNLPPVSRKFIRVKMNPGQKRLYNLMKSEEARQAESSLRSWDRNTLRALGKSAIRLLQLSSNPALIAHLPISDQEILRAALAEGDSPKINYACNRARELAKAGKKTIIWSTFVPNVELIASRLRDLGADYIHGGVEAGSEEDSDTREFKIQRFHDDSRRSVLVANPAACSEGISLHEACHNAIYIDRNYNAAQYLQSEDRIHRLGLSPGTATEVEILFSPETIDESVRRRLEAKVEKMAKVLNDSSLSIEGETADLEDEGIDDADANDILNHLKSP